MNNSRTELYLIVALIMVLGLAQAFTMFQLFNAQSQAEALAQETEKLLLILDNSQMQMTVTSESDTVVTSQVRLPEYFEARVDTEIPVHHVFTVGKDIPMSIPLPASFAVLGLDVLQFSIPLETQLELNANVPIQQDVLIRVDEDIQFTTVVPTHTSIPVSVNIDQTPLQDQLHIVRNRLNGISDTNFLFAALR